MVSIRRIEEKTRQQVTISTGLTSANLFKSNVQIQSPLFNRLPAELRNMIFCFATRPDHHPKVTWNKYHQEFQPDDSGSYKHLTSLLQTCRLVWLETNYMLLQQATHRFFFNSFDYDAPGYAICDAKAQRHLEFCRSLTPNGRLNLHHIHYWSRSCAEEGNKSVTWPGICLSRLRAKTQWLHVPCFVPEMVTVTVRYDGLKRLSGYRRGYLSQLTDVIRFAADGATLTFRLELEAPAADAAELRDVVETLESWQVVRENEYWLETRQEHLEISRLVLQSPTEECSRTVPASRPHEQRDVCVGEKVDGEESMDMEHVVFTLTWKRIRWRDYDSTRPVPSATISAAAMEVARNYEQLWALQGSLLEFVVDAWSGHDAMKRLRFAQSHGIGPDLVEEAK
ncbi:hypothetical protein LTR09_006511 [Extremus antarcticus]|uniref:2EXR domain-containing protein n=1 Tax=Extremus antarcticus TaxID=702011 RepID=A0AAJ0DL58_9PEZI|nr:hypothetical protein LTR09_006511 [Extremus antarcticus]